MRDLVDRRIGDGLYDFFCTTDLMGLLGTEMKADAADPLDDIYG